MNANKQDAGGLPELPETMFVMRDEETPAYSEDQMRAIREESFKAGMKFCRDNELCRAAPAGGDVPFDTVRSVCRALTRLGHSTPESQEEQAARSVELVNTLCREVQSHFDSLGSAPAGSGEADASGILIHVQQLNLDGHLDQCALDELSALLRKLQQGADYVMVPRELTAENGAKAVLTGEVQVRLREGQPWVPVSWTAIKELHRKMVAHFDRAASQDQEGGNDA